VEWSGGTGARILIIGWPSTIPGDYVKSLTAEWTALGVSRFLVSETAPVSPGQKREFLSMLEHATGVFFTGGDQNRAMAAVESLALRSVLKDRFDSGVPFGGTSAGTALMAETMITGREDPRTAPGLGLLPRALIDMHFLKRSREPRLLAAMENAGVHFGIGVDEDGAVVIEDSIRAEVLGTPHVVFYDSSSGQVRRFELGDRDRFDLMTWTP
jgi:cyanophycinase